MTDYSLLNERLASLISGVSHPIANLANATEDSPIDATFAVMNPSFGYNAKTSLWTGSYTTYGGVDNNKCIEQWNRTFDMYQTITGLPNGVYKMQCQGFYRMGGGSNDAGAAATARTNGTEVLNAKIEIYFRLWLCLEF